MKRFLAFSSAVLISACTVGPDYRQPASNAPSQWGAEPAAASRTYAGAVDIGWWHSFADPQLDDLVARLGRQNLELQAAAQRIGEARAQTQVAAAQGLPSANWAGAYTWTQQSTHGFLSLAEPAPGANLQYNYYTNIASASWDLDLFGMVRRTVEAQRADAAAVLAARRGVALATLSDLVATYMRLRGTQAQIVLTQKDLGLVKHDLALVQDRQREGAATTLDVAQARARVAVTEGALPPLRDAQAALINAIGLLLALPPRALEPMLEPVRPQPQVPLGVPVGFPSELAQRRPDLMQADARLHAATARIGAAKASFYPDITLTGSLGTQSLSASDFFLPAAKYFQLGPTLNVPLFEGGRLRGMLHLRESEQKEAALAYREAVLNAWREVDDAMTAYAQAQERYRRVSDAVTQDKAALAAARQRYIAGAVTFLEFDTAEAALLSSETAEAAAQTQIETQLVALYRALGGGWQFAETPVPDHKGA